MTAQFAALYLLGGLPCLVWAGAVRLVLLYHVTWFVNSAAHVWGDQAYNTGAAGPGGGEFVGLGQEVRSLGRTVLREGGLAARRQAGCGGPDAVVQRGARTSLPMAAGGSTKPATSPSPTTTPTQVICPGTTGG